MNESIGEFLRSLRTAKGVSLSQLAARAALGRRTLSYWEANTYQPRLPELQAVLEALGASDAQRQQAITLIHAPRAAQSLRDEPQLLRQPEEIGPMISGGDLLRAMRHRRRLLLEPVASALGVSGGTLSRWEQGKVVPSVEHLDALLTLLRAHPEEQAVLKTALPFLRSPLPEQASSCDALRARFMDFLHMHYERRSDPLHDLCFLTFAATAWPMATGQKAGRELLAEIYAHYATYLADALRYGEAKQYALRALDLQEDKSTPESYYVRAAIVCAKASVHGGRQPMPQRGLEWLRLWLPLTRPAAFRAWILGDIAGYVALEGALETALELSKQACHIAEEQAHPNEVHFRQLGLARLQIQAGQAEEALSRVILRPQDDPFWQAMVELVWVEGLLALGERSSAHGWLQRLIDDIERNGLEHLRPHAEALGVALQAHDLLPRLTGVRANMK
jgi:transcriptional regulator with XRE-family HTH domain